MTYHISFSKQVDNVGHYLQIGRCAESKNCPSTFPLFRLFIQIHSSHGQSSYWTAKSSFLFLASDHTEADPGGGFLDHDFL